MFDRRLTYCLLFAVSWSLAIFFRKIALNQGAHPVTFLFQSGLISVVLLTTNVWFVRRKDLTKIRPKFLTLIGIMGLFVGLAWIADTWGLNYTSSINYSFVIKSGFVFSILLAFIFFKEKLSFLKNIFISAFIVGAYMVTTGGQRVLPQYGDVLVLTAAFLYSCGTIAQKKLVSILHPDIIAWLRTSSAVFILLLMLPMFHITNYSFKMPVYILIVGILLTCTSLFLNKALKVSSVTYITMMNMSVPVINGILGYLFLNETLNAIQLMGAGVLTLSIVLIQKLKI